MSSQRNIKISLKFKVVLTCLFAVIISIGSYSQNEKFKVVLDAGHGGKDPGTLGKASYKNSYESDIALKVTLAVGNLLKQNSEIETIYTRKKNVFIPLHQRGNIANKADADLFISVHCNAASSNAYGTTTYVLGMGKTQKNLELAKRENDVIFLEDDYEKHYDYDPNSEEFMIGLTLMQEDYIDKSIEFAQIVQNKFVSVAKRKNRGVNQGNLAVLYDSYMPSVLIEIGFLSNKIEEKFLHTTTGQQKIAKAIYEAIKTYKRRLDNNSISDTNEISSISDTEDNVDSEKKYGPVYKVQIATSKRKIETKPYNFKQLKGVERLKVGNIYKYYYSSYPNLEKAKKIRKEVIKLGYKDAFIKRFIELPKDTKKEITSSINDNNNVSLDNTKDYFYCVQIATSTSNIETKPYNFKGLKYVTKIKVGSIYKYFYGSTTELDSAKTIRKKVIDLGYKDAFVKRINKTKNNKVVPTKNKKNRIYNDVIFKVQITSGKRKIETKPYNFKGLKNIERIQLGSFYKYYYGKTSNFDEIEKLHKEAVAKGYKDAVIVAIKNNKLISVKSLISG